MPTSQTIRGVNYIKISKEDCNSTNNNIALQQAETLRLVYPNSNTYADYPIVSIVDKGSYFLIETAVVDKKSLPDSEILDYEVVVKRTGNVVINAGADPVFLTGFDTPTKDGQGYFNDISGTFNFQDTPNTILNYTLSFSITSNTNGNTGSIALLKSPFDLNEPNSGVNVNSHRFIVNTGTTTNMKVSGTFDAMNLESFIFLLSNDTTPSDTGNLTFSSINLEYSQIYAPQSGSCNPLLIEPYLDINFNNSDFNPLINNITQNNLSNIFMVVDFKNGKEIPSNIQAIVSGTAEPADVKDYNYIIKSHINPRYLGSKSSSHYLNKWSNKDEGTYGKLPTIESLKRWVAYCDGWGGYPPEKMNSSWLKIKYLIGPSGSVKIPNTSEFSLFENQGTFQTNERVIVQTQESSLNNIEYRNIIRGGSRIEPILYTQISHTENLNWTQSLTLKTSDPLNNPVGNYKASLGVKANPPQNDHYTTYGQGWGNINFNRILSSGSESSLSTQSVAGSTGYIYQINTGSINDGVSIALNTTINIYNNSSETTSAYIRFYNLDTQQSFGWIGDDNIPPYTYQALNLSYLISNENLINGHRYTVQASVGKENTNFSPASNFTITQYPGPDAEGVLVSNIFISGTLPLNVPSGTLYNYNNFIYTTASFLIDNILQQNPQSEPDLYPYYQQDITYSGFNPIQTPWSLQYGDEFRFEGREDRVFMVKHYEVAEESGISKLLIELSKPIPTSGSMNLDQFLLRRYVDDASSFIVEGFKPLNTNGPYIIKPEFVTEEMNKNINDYILLLTEKNLI